MIYLPYIRASPVAQLAKNPPAVWETWVRSLDWEDPLKEGRERLPTSVFWPGEFHGLCSPCGRKELDTAEQLSLSPYIRVLAMKGKEISSFAVQ